jgi:hypothetical protein
MFKIMKERNPMDVCGVGEIRAFPTGMLVSVSSDPFSNMMGPYIQQHDGAMAGTTPVWRAADLH